MRERSTVLLLHGGPGSFDHSYFMPDFARLAEVAQVVYLDLPGHGRSDHGDAESWTFESCADGVRDLCEAVGLEHPVVYGHSLGGMVAMVLAARHPELPGALVLQSARGGSTSPRSSRSCAGSAGTRWPRPRRASTAAKASR